MIYFIIKFSLSIFFVLGLSATNSQALAEGESNHSRIGRLPCPLVLKNCTSIQALEENDYLPQKSEEETLEGYINATNIIYTPEELENFCKSCVVKLSRDSKCITRGIKKCKKNFTANSSSNTGGSNNTTPND